MQAEYSTDLVFGSRDALSPLYNSLVRTAVHAVKADNVATFLGRKLDPRYQGELGNSFHTRIEGTPFGENTRRIRRMLVAGAMMEPLP